jgi:hypothetical protein
MSALGQKQTFAMHQPMSALAPKADICGAKRNVRFGPKADIRLSINYLISELLEQQGNVDAEGLRRFLIDKELKFGRLLDG